MNHAELKARHRAIRDQQKPDLSVRIHRALSWLERAERETDDDDARFVFSWIAFNAAYATYIHEDYRETEQAQFGGFVSKLLALDDQRRLADMVWQSFAGPLRVLLGSKFIYSEFWRYQSGHIGPHEWEARFQRDNQRSLAALAQNNTHGVLCVALSRIYTLRNQLVHGGATWQSTVNREQVTTCARILDRLVPIVIELMMDHPDALWGEAVYPVVTDE